MSEVKKYQDTGERPAEKKVHTEEAKPDAGRLYGEGEEPGREELHDGIGRSEADMLYVMMGSAAPKRTCFMMKNFSAELKTQRREGRSSAADTVSFLRR